MDTASMRADDLRWFTPPARSPPGARRSTVVADGIGGAERADRSVRMRFGAGMDHAERCIVAADRIADLGEPRIASTP